VNIMTHLKNKNLFIYMLLGLSFFIFGTVAFAEIKFLGRDISLVKNGYLNFDQSLTVGQAFETYKYFGKKEWTTLKDERGRKYVIFKAQMNKDYLKETNKQREEVINNPTLMNIMPLPTNDGIIITQEWVIQFTINYDSTYIVSDIKHISVYTSGKTTSSDLVDINTVLHSIYENIVAPQFY